MFSDKSDWSDWSDILLKGLLIRLVREVGLVRDPIKPLKNLRWQPSTPPYGGDGGGPIFSQQNSPRAVEHVGKMNDKLNLTYFLSQ